jgi:GNAT superfamily N-acetyltransferase
VSDPLALGPMSPAALPALDIAPRRDEDVRLLFKLAKDAFGAMPGWSDERTIELLAQDTVFVGHENRDIVGFVALGRTGAESVVIELMLVAPGHEGRGIGRRLLAFAEGWSISAGARSLGVLVEADNARARSFYVRSGFMPVADERLELVLPQES